MSQRERDRLKVMASVLEGKRKLPEAARLLKRSVRQVRRVKRRLVEEGDSGIIHRLRGRPSNNLTKPALRREVLQLYRARYLGFGPTLAAEKFQAQGLEVSDETLRNWLIAEGLWQRKRHRDKHRSRRDRRACFGELVQADGSHHDWLEGRGQSPHLCLLRSKEELRSVHWWLLCGRRWGQWLKFSRAQELRQKAWSGRRVSLRCSRHPSWS